MTTTDSSKPQAFVDHQRFLDCVHCGLCLSACPTYLETGKEMDSPRGRILLLKSVQEGRLALTETVVKHIDLCLGCRACEVACPSGVQYGEILEHGRDFIERNYQRSPFQTWLRRIFIEGVLPYPTRMEFALIPVRLLQVLRLDRLLSGLPPFRSLTLMPDLSQSISKPLPQITRPQGAPRARVGMISGCVMSVLFSKTNEATLRLLARSGCEVNTPREQVCCGALFLHGGSLEKAKQCARRNIDVFEKLNLDAIIINAAGCGSTLKEYGKLLRDDPRYATRAAVFSQKVKDLSELLVDSRFETRDSQKPSSGSRITPALRSATQASNREAENHESRVTYHDACHLAHPQGIKAAPRGLVRAVEGIEFVELPEADVCCGSAGSYNLTEPEMADQLQRRKVENIKKTGATVVVTTNPGCILQIQAGLKKDGSTTKVMHLADFLEEARKDK